MELLVARTASEREQASLRAAGEVLEVSRKHARETTEMLREKMEEVERLRMYKQMDDRERAVKVKSLVGEVSYYQCEGKSVTTHELGCRTKSSVNEI
jgi:50S ribosomal subunit-associated GTPase HflX